MIGDRFMVFMSREMDRAFSKAIINSKTGIKKKNKYIKSRNEDVEDHKRRTKQGRNEPCNCGSGKKFKKCCGGVINKED